MKGKMKKILALALATVMLLAMGMTAMADNTSATTPTITIKNAAVGETYKVYKIFDATRSSNGNMAYKLMSGKTKDGLPAGFEVNASGYVTKAPDSLDGNAVNQLISYVGLTWNEDAKEYTGVDPYKTATGNGETLQISLDDYGYYLVVSSTGSVVSINDSDPNAVIVDKNPTKPTVPNDAKTVADDDVYIGQEVEYTLKFETTNYVVENGATEATEPKQIDQYIITDTLPEFLTDVKVTSVKVTSGTEPNVSEEVLDASQLQFDNKTITIDWRNADGSSKYANGAMLEIKYTAKVTDQIQLGTANKNTVTLSWKYVDGTSGGGEGNTAEETISTYAIVIQKVDKSGYNLAGAKFVIEGYEVAGSNGSYKITGVKSGDSIEMDCDSDGKLVIYGLAQNGDGATTPIEYQIKETQAPDGYNLKADPTPVKAQKVSTETTKVYYDENGEEVSTETTSVKTPETQVSVQIINETGVELPSTGGIGTTIFYVVGGILVLGACVLLVTKKRMSARD